MKLNPSEIKNAKRLIRMAFEEDQISQDVTTRFFVPAASRSVALIHAKQAGVLAGVETAVLVFKTLNPKLKTQILRQDGSLVRKNDVVLRVSGPLRSILSAERTALNFLGHLSGVATLTHEYSKIARAKKIHIMDTRKTTPGFRLLEKYAVRCGGGRNHRSSLEGAAFIKDNHWRYENPENWKAALKKLKEMGKELVVEVENERQFSRALELKPHVILFDNLSPQVLRRLCLKVRKSGVQPRPLCEASGGIHLGNIRRYLPTGIDRISVGAITHSAASLDFSLEIL